jgi:hypothetical protein
MAPAALRLLGLQRLRSASGLPLLITLKPPLGLLLLLLLLPAIAARATLPAVPLLVLEQVEAGVGLRPRIFHRRPLVVSIAPALALALARRRCTTEVITATA